MPIYHLGHTIAPRRQSTFGDVQAATLVPAAFIVLAASLVKGTTAFGFALVATPLLLLLWEPRQVVSITIPLAMAVDILIVFQNRRRLEPKRILPMVAAAALGIPLGNYLLLVASKQALTLAIAAVAMASALVLLLGYTIALRRERVAGGIAGFISGILSTSTANSGPPVVLFMVNQKWNKDTFRSSLSMFFVFNEAMSIASLAVSGVLTGKTLLVDVALWPVVLAGFGIASLLVARIPQGLFRRIAAVVVIASALLAIVSELVKR
ncbi:MAG: sulfite exporter TauE/SafE family protein [Dehalococcoidia bacterium]|nr:sulfite exporter TauE/SafE family protein [Dehalococcoidia bacterium]